jgi:hypothetical protein
MDNNKDSRFLVLLETSGNQHYIFSTNKLKENIGASELTYRAGTQWVLEVVSDLNHTEEFKNSDRLRENLLNKKLNPPIETSDKPIEIIIATSGKALLLTKHKATARDIIKKVTLRALQEAPGLDLCGVFVGFNWNQKGGLVKAVAKVYQEFQKVHSKISSPAMRFLQLPMLEQCKNSGFPASCLVINPEQKKVPVSQISWKKQQETQESLKRLNKILKDDKSRRKLIENVNQLEQKFEQELEWLAVVHADGNGLGQIFLNFDKYLQDKDNQKDDPREYIDKLREFSLALDLCTEKAFLKAIDHISTNANNELALVPIVLGGDDLTVICDGKFALRFTQSFLEEFECETSQPQRIGTHEMTVILDLAKKAFNEIDHLSACAGVAIIKPHFPFSVAYELAENLIKSAKETQKIITQVIDQKKQPYPCSALDFHILYDSSDVQLKVIREKLEIEQAILHNRPYVITTLENLKQAQVEKTKLHNRPYVITSMDKLKQAQGKEWAEFHHWDKLVEKAKAIKDTDEEGKKKLPSSQTHALRAALFLGKEVADARYKLIRDRYQKEGIETLAGSPDSPESLFQKEPNSQESETTYTTGLLDAIDAAEFLHSKEEPAKNV